MQKDNSGLFVQGEYGRGKIKDRDCTETSSLEWMKYEGDWPEVGTGGDQWEKQSGRMAYAYCSENSGERRRVVVFEFRQVVTPPERPAVILGWELICISNKLSGAADQGTTL